MADKLRTHLPFNVDINELTAKHRNYADVLNEGFFDQFASNDTYLKGEQDKIKEQLQEGLPAKGGNADTVDECHAGTGAGNVLKLNLKAKVPESALAEAVKKYWQPSTTYGIGDIVAPLNFTKQFIFICIEAGMTNTSQPVWQMTDEAEFMDGSVKWKAIDLRDAETLQGKKPNNSAGNIVVLDAGGKIPLALLSMIQNSKIAESFLSGAAKRWWRPNTTYQEGNIIEPLGALYGQFFECVQAGTTGTTEPAWPAENNSEFTDGSAKWRTKGFHSLGGKVGDINFPTYTVDDNHLKLNGALLLRASYPQLFEWAEKNNLFVSEATWQAVDATTGLQLPSGLFSTGDGTTTFRLPDHRGLFYRTLDEGRNIDKDGTSRELGSIQGDAIRNITGEFAAEGNKRDIAGAHAIGAFAGFGYGRGHSSGLTGGSAGWNFSAGRVVPVGSDNRPSNIGLFATIQYK